MPSRDAARCCSASRFPIAVLAILLSLTLPDIYTSSALVEIDEPSSAQSLTGTSAESSYADQYVQNLKGIVLTDANLRKLNKEHNLYPVVRGQRVGRRSSACAATSTCRS